MARRSILLVLAIASGSLFSGTLAGTNKFGKKWLKKNAKLTGVKTLPSGLQYKALTTGNGSFHPLADSKCKCHLEGRTASYSSKWRTMFESSYAIGAPKQFAPSEQVAGVAEAMLMMVEGDKWEVYMPSELGYGDSGKAPDIQSGDVLIFIIEILEIQGGKIPACDVKTLKRCNNKEKEYILKHSSKGKEHIEGESRRLEGMRDGQMHEGKVPWLNKRIELLGHMLGQHHDEL